MAHFQPVVFVDTNAVHFARLFLRFARRCDLRPVGTDPTDPEEAIKQEFVGQTQDSYERGRKLVNYLVDQSNAGVRLEYSPVTRLELATGLLRGKAVLNAAEQGLAHRMWSRMDETEILNRLDSSAFADIQDIMGELEEDFGEAGILLVEADPGKLSEVWSLASRIIGITYLDLGDCAVYASTLLAEADELITADKYFRQVADRVQNPGGAPPAQQPYFVDANNKMKVLLSEAIGISTSEIVLPKAAKRW